MTHSGPFAVDASFRFDNVQDLMIDSLAKQTPHDLVNRVTADFQWCCGLAIILWADVIPSMHSLLWTGKILLHFTRSLRWVEQNYSYLILFYSWCCLPKIIKPAKVLRSYSKNNTGTLFWDTVSYIYICDTSSSSHRDMFSILYINTRLLNQPRVQDYI